MEALYFGASRATWTFPHLPRDAKVFDLMTGTRLCMLASSFRLKVQLVYLTMTKCVLSRNEKPNLQCRSPASAWPMFLLNYTSSEYTSSTPYT